MEKYKVQIIERLIKNVEVDAESEADAESIVRDQYNNQVHILDSDDFSDVDFVVKPKTN